MASIEKGVRAESELTSAMDETMESPPPEKSAYELARDCNVVEVQKYLAPALAM